MALGSTILIRLCVGVGLLLASNAGLVQPNPLAGTMWVEEAQIACGTLKEVAPETPIAQMDFQADGTFKVAWKAFETYWDYWGRYTYDLKQSSLNLVVSGGNYVPKDLDGSGLFSIDTTPKGGLVMMDMWLGRPEGSTASSNCGHRFARTR